MSITADLVTSTGPARGTLPPRARYATDAVVLDLSGDWDFRFHPRAGRAPDLPEVGTDVVTLPGMWQLQGHGSPAYTNVQLPFPADPPHVPDDNPAGDHHRDLDLPDLAGRRALLRLDGADSVAAVWLNGLFVGETRGSRNTHELDLTPYAVPGRNDLRIRVVQWSAASYLEDQDMWWLSGLFRPVAVVLQPDRGLDDVRVRADWDHERGVGVLRVDVDTDDDAALVALPALGLVDLAPGVAVDVPGVRPWSAEDPALYDLEVATSTERATLRIGFRSVEIVDAQLRVNGIPVHFRGVNRHDHHPDRGRAVTEAEVRADLLLMKRHNVNAVRTAHYPPLPVLLDLADELGLWVIDEADVETHGFVEVGYRANPLDDPAYEDALVDRVQRMVARDRNHPSVIVWSLGNESGAGRNVAPMRAAALALDDTRPVHYERDWTFAHSDLMSLMYTPVDVLERIGRFDGDAGTASGIGAAVVGHRDPAHAAELARKPFVLIEYAHAMGTGPGGLREYAALFRRYPRLQGGFVWEWIEHGLTTTAPDGRHRLAYGGDFGEAVHDKNFVADGLLDPHRRPRPGLADVKAAFAPVEVTVEPGAVRVTNLFERGDTGRLAFVADWADADGGTTRTSVAVPVLGPDEHATVALAPPERAAGTVLVTVRALLADATAWADAGHEVAVGQRLLGAPAAAPARAGTSWTVDDDLLAAGPVRLERPTLGAWRASTDNDLAARMVEMGRGTSDAAAWAALHLHAPSGRTVAVERPGDGRTTVRRRWGFAGRDVGVDATARTREDDGVLHLDVDLVPFGPWPADATLARLGLDLELPGLGPDTCVRWFGKGFGQSYPDTGDGMPLGWWAGTVAELQEHYLRPQDNGVRSEVRALWVEHRDATLQITGEPFAFSLRPWSDRELHAADHPDDLPTTERLVLSLNAAGHGVGTAACGPGVLPAYRLEPRPTQLRLQLAVVDA